MRRTPRPRWRQYGHTTGQPPKSCPVWDMRRQSAWVLVVFGWSRDLHAVCVDCSGVGRVQCVQQRPLGGCGSRPIRHSDGVGGWYRLTEPSHSCWEGQPTGQGVGKSEINPRAVRGSSESASSMQGGQAGGHDVTNRRAVRSVGSSGCAGQASWVPAGRTARWQ